MTGAEARGVPRDGSAEAAVARLAEMSPDLLGSVVLDSDDRVLAASGDPERWGMAAAELLSAADHAGAEPAEHVHVATEDGEVFAVRHQGLAMVAAAERFVLASLMVFDMRAILRDLTREGG